jgi:hypothetical protein
VAGRGQTLNSPAARTASLGKRATVTSDESRDRRPTITSVALEPGRLVLEIGEASVRHQQ